MQLIRGSHARPVKRTRPIVWLGIARGPGLWFGPCLYLGSRLYYAVLLPNVRWQ